MSEIIKSEPIDVEEFTQKRSKRGRKRKTTDSENELKASYDKESNEYKKKRLRNNIAVRKSRDKGTGLFINSLSWNLFLLLYKSNVER